MKPAKRVLKYGSSAMSILGSARVSRVGFGVAPKQAFLAGPAVRLAAHSEKFAKA
jgi:hypothetical protein